MRVKRSSLVPTAGSRLNIFIGYSKQHLGGAPPSATRTYNLGVYYYGVFWD